MFCQLSRLNFPLRRVFTCEQLDQRASHGAAAPRLYLKAEHEQKIGAFKIRGAINAICSLAFCIQIQSGTVAVPCGRMLFLEEDDSGFQDGSRVVVVCGCVPVFSNLQFAARLV